MYAVFIALIFGACWCVTVFFWFEIRNREKMDLSEMKELLDKTIEASNKATDTAVNAYARAEEALQRIGRYDVSKAVGAAGLFGGVGTDE